MIPDLQKLMRADLLENFEPYSSAEVSIKDKSQYAVLNANENPFEAIGLEGLNYHRYAPQQPPELVEAVSKAYNLSPDQFVMTRGSDEAIDLLIRVFCAAGEDSILINPPTFPMYKVSATLQNAKVIQTPLLKDGESLRINFEGLREEILKPENKIKLCFICAPNAPTGTPFNAKDILAFCEEMRGHCIFVIDQAYAEFDPDSCLLYALPENPHMIILRTLSKAYALAGERLGFAANSDPDFIKFMKNVLAPYPIAKSAADAGVAALSPENIEKSKKDIAFLKDECTRVVDAFKKSGNVEHVYPSVTNFFFCRIKNAHKFVQYCQDHHVLIRDFSGKPGTENCIRISVGAREENDKIITLLHSFSG